MSTGDWSLRVAERVQMGPQLWASSWAIEKLCKVVEGLAQARDVVPGIAQGVEYSDLAAGLYEAYRNACKVATWVGLSDEYSEEATEKAFLEGGQAMKNHVELYLGQVLRK
jgi:hypothetical protein